MSRGPSKRTKKKTGYVQKQEDHISVLFSRRDHRRRFERQQAKSCECEDFMQQSQTSHNTAARIKAGNLPYSRLTLVNNSHRLPAGPHSGSRRPAVLRASKI